MPKETCIISSTNVKESDMTEKHWRIFAVIAAVGCLSGFFKWQYATGYLLGCFFSVVTYKILEHFCDDAIRMRNPSGSMGHFVLNFGIWAAVLIVSVFLDQYLNVIACAIGLTAVKMSIIIGSFLIKE